MKSIIYTSKGNEPKPADSLIPVNSFLSNCLTVQREHPGICL
jgi:hypothetical protein